MAEKQSVLDGRFADFGLTKIGHAIPMLLAAALVTYISFQFVLRFLPEVYPVSHSIIIHSFVPNFLLTSFIF